MEITHKQQDDTLKIAHKMEQSHDSEQLLRLNKPPDF